MKATKATKPNSASISSTDIFEVFSFFGFKRLGAMWVLSLGENNILEAYLNNAYIQEYNQIRVAIISRHKGEITRNWFDFNNHLKTRTNPSYRGAYLIDPWTMKWRDQQEPLAADVVAMIKEVVEWGNFFRD